LRMMIKQLGGKLKKFFKMVRGRNSNCLGD